MASPIGSSSSALRSRSATLSVGSPRPRSRRSCSSRAGREHEDQERVGVALADLAGPVDLDLEHHVGAARAPRAWACRRSCRGSRSTRGSRRRAMRCSKACRVDEDVGVVGLARPLRPGRPRPAEPERRDRASSRARTTVPLPTPPGPEMTMIRGVSPAARGATGAAAGPRPSHPAGLADPDLLHGAAGLDLADAGERFEQREHLQLADDVVACRPAPGRRPG